MKIKKDIVNTVIILTAISITLTFIKKLDKKTEITNPWEIKKENSIENEQPLNKEIYTEDEFIELLNTNDAKIIYEKDKDRYFVNTHVPILDNFISPEGFLLYQEYLYVQEEPNKGFYAVNNYLSIRPNSKGR